MINRPPLARYATNVASARGRLHPEPESAHRTPFQRDRDRIIHSSAFRRLKHKTQVFVEHEGDHYRTRLTHTLEVAQIARTVARTLGADEDLAEAVALAHDLGHTPFGHTGEDALNAAMAAHGGFDHNAQALKIVTDLERRYAEFDGLNLTWEVLEGIAKHNGPLITGMDGERSGLHFALAEYDSRHDLELWTHAGLEAQIAAISDDIAYNTHDLDDGLRAGLFGFDELAELPLVGPSLREVRGRYAGLDAPRLAHEAFRRVFGLMVEDLLAETAKRLKEAAPENAEALRNLPAPVAGFSVELNRDLLLVRKFLFERMYRHWQVKRMRRKAASVVKELFDIFIEEPGLMPPDWSEAALHSISGDHRARVVADYIAGMTDRYALDEHHKLTDPAALG